MPNDIESLLGKEDDFLIFDKFFGSQEKAEDCFAQIINKEKQKASPKFVFHTTQQQSIEVRKTGGADDKYFSFSTEAFQSLMMLEHRFLGRLRHSGFVMTNDEKYKPVFLIVDYEKIKVNQGFNERPGREKGHEIEIKVPFSIISQNALVVDSAGRFEDLIDYFSKVAADSEYKEVALRGLNNQLQYWQEIDQLKEEKSK